MRSRILLALSAWLIAAVPPVGAADVGLYLRDNPASLSNPVAFQTWVFDTTERTLKYFDGVGYTRVTFPVNTTAITDPTANDDASTGYFRGSTWINTSTLRNFTLLDDTTGAAVWKAYANSNGDPLLTFRAADPTANNEVVNRGYADLRYAALAGSASQLFSAASPTGSTHVAPLSYLQASFAALSGSAGQVFNVAPATANDHAVSRSFGDARYAALAGLSSQTFECAAATIGTHALNRDAADARFTPSGTAANRVLAAPDGTSGTPTYRLLVNGDLPTVAITKGGTGQVTALAGFDALAPTPVGKGYVQVYNTTSGHWATLSNAGAADDGKALSVDSTTVLGAKWVPMPGTGTATRVALTMPAEFSVAGSPITTSGTLAVTRASQTANTFLAAPNGSAGVPTFRAIVSADLPSGVFFGGSGADGARTVSSTTSETTAIKANYTTVTVNNAVTWTVKSRQRINATSTVTIGGGTSGILTIANEGNGGTVSPSTSAPAGSGSGPSPGQSAGTTAVGGGGGGCGGAGGNGGHSASAYTGGRGGPALPISMQDYGSGGAAATAATAGNGTAGGHGGGQVVIAAVGAVSIAAGASITAPGTDGVDGTGTNAAGPGGGSGGVVIIASSTSITNSGTVSAIGGAGGDFTGSYPGGGGGGGGIIVFYAPTVTAGTQTVTAGAAGATGGGTGAPTAGSAGVTLNITGTPTLPILGMLSSPKWIDSRWQYGGPLGAIAQMASALGQRELAQIYADGDLVRYARAIGDTTDGTVECIGIGDEVRQWGV